MSELHAWTDGACSGNPGPGGWGVVLRAIRDGQILKERELSGGEAQTTNNRMELMAAIAALETLTRPSTITITTDSAYVKNGVTQWIHGWKRNGWRTADRKPVKNAELWQRLDAAQARHQVRWEWIRGHAGHPENERADALARAGMAPFKPARPGRPAEGAPEGAGGIAAGIAAAKAGGNRSAAKAGPKAATARPAGTGRGR